MARSEYGELYDTITISSTTLQDPGFRNCYKVWLAKYEGHQGDARVGVRQYPSASPLFRRDSSPRHGSLRPSSSTLIRSTNLSRATWPAPIELYMVT